MVRHDVRPLLDLLLLRVPCPQGHIVILLSFINNVDIDAEVIVKRTSVRLTGASFPTMLPAVEAFCLMLASSSFASVRLATTCASSSFFFATSSSAFSLAYQQTFCKYTVE